MNANNRATLFHHSFSVYRAAVLIIRFPFFPAGLFIKKPRKIIFAGNVRFADGRARRLYSSRFLSFLFGSFSFTERKRT